jgi:hypothetical protein
MTRPTSVYVLNDEEEDAPDLRTINMVVYGYPGIGKTPFWGTGGERVLFMDSDKGLESAEAAGSKASAMPVIDYESLTEAYEYVKHEVIPNKLYDWVVWDSITLFQDRALIDDVLKDAAAANPRQDPHVASQREYLVNQNRMMEFVRMFVDLDINFGVSAHVLPVEDAEGNLIYMPDVRGKNMPSKLTGYMNVVAYMVRKEGHPFRFITEPRDHYFARDRFNALKTNGKGFVNEPTVPKIEALIAKARAERASGKPAAPARPRRRRPTSAS